MKKITSGIYIIENQINGKIYVGQTVDVTHRYKTHLHTFKHKKYCLPKLHRAFNKYGIQNFKYKIIAKCPIEYLNIMEKKFISLYDSFENGYNSNRGGNVITPRKKVIQLNKEYEVVKYYNSITEASNKTKDSMPTISRCINFNQKISRKGNVWVTDLKDIEKVKKLHSDAKIRRAKAQKNICDKLKILNRKSILQYTKQNVFVKKYSSVTSAAKQLNTNPSNISAALSPTNKRKSCCGFIWKYENK